MKPAITDTAPAGLWRRLGWFFGIWVASVAALGALAMLIRLALKV